MCYAGEMKLKSEIEHLAWDPSMRYVVYALYCACEDCTYADGDSYLKYGGQTTRSAKERLSHHRIVGRMISRGTLSAVKKMTPVGYWAAKHGPDNIHMIILETCRTLDELNEAEARWIERLETLTSQGGLNIRGGGKNFLHGPMSDEQKAKIGTANKGFKPAPEQIERVRKMMTESRGEKNYTSVLTEVEVIEIKRRLFYGESQTSVAEDYAVTASTISHIFKRKTWWEVPQPIGPIPKTIYKNGFGEDAAYRKLDNAKVAEIKNRLWSGEFPADIAPSFGVDVATIHGIEAEKSWSHIPWPVDRPRVIRDSYARVREKNTGRKRPEGWGDENRRVYRENSLKKSKLNRRQIRHARAMRFEQGMTYTQIADYLGIRPLLVGKIIRGERWGWVE